MRDPSAVVSVFCLALFVGAHLGDRGGVGRFVVFDRDKSGHAAHRVRAAAMTCADEQARIRAQKRRRHRHRLALGQDSIGLGAQGFNVRKNIIPTAAIQADGAPAQGVQNFVHLKRRRQCLDQQRRFGRAALDPQPLLGERNDILPQRRLAPVLGFRQIQIRAATARAQSRRAMKNEKSEIGESGGDRIAVLQNIFFAQMPAARADDENAFVVGILLVALAGGGVGGATFAARGFEHRGLRFDKISPSRRERVLEIGHKRLGRRVQGENGFFAVGGRGDFDSAILQIGRRRRDLPIAFADGAGFGRKIGQRAVVDFSLRDNARGENLLAARSESPRQIGHKSARRRRENHRRVGRLCVAQKAQIGRVHLLFLLCFFQPAGENVAMQYSNPRRYAKKTATVATVAANRLGVSARPAARRIFWRRGFARRKRAFRLDATAIRARDRNRAGACSPKHGIRVSPLAGDRARPRRRRNRQRRKSARRKRSASCNEGKNRGGHSAKFGFVASARRATKNRAARLRAKS